MNYPQSLNKVNELEMNLALTAIHKSVQLVIPRKRLRKDYRLRGWILTLPDVWTSFIISQTDNQSSRIAELATFFFLVCLKINLPLCVMFHRTSITSHIVLGKNDAAKINEQKFH